MVASTSKKRARRDAEVALFVNKFVVVVAAVAFVVVLR